MKEGFLADAQTDFIFAIITEELGIVFSLVLIFSYFLLLSSKEVQLSKWPSKFLLIFIYYLIPRPLWLYKLTPARCITANTFLNF